MSSSHTRNMKRMEIRKLRRWENDLWKNVGEKNESSEIEAARSLGGRIYARLLVKRRSSWSQLRRQKYEANMIWRFGWRLKNFSEVEMSIFLIIRRREEWLVWKWSCRTLHSLGGEKHAHLIFRRETWSDWRFESLGEEKMIWVRMAARRMTLLRSKLPDR